MIEKYINDFLSQLGAGSRETVYLSVSPGSGLEMIQVDAATRTVKAYSHRPLAYNDSLREIADYEEFKTGVEELFAELRISPKCNIVVNMPMVLFGSINLPLLLSDDAITEAITSEVEQSYIFKRYDPSVSWMDAVSTASNGDTRKIFYSAVQQVAIEYIKNFLTELGANVIGIEMSLSSTLRALDYTGLTKEQMSDNMTWNLLKINQTGYSIVSMTGKNIIDYYEEPLAIKSFEGDEIYSAICASAQITLMSYPANYLYILSETDLVSAELLSKKIQVESAVDYLENNSFKRQEFLPASLDILPDNVLKITLDAIGTAVSRFSNYPVDFNFAGAHADASAEENVVLRFKLGDKDIELTPAASRNIAGIASAILVIPLLACFFLFPNLVSKEQAKVDDINNQVTAIEQQIQEFSDNQAKYKDFDAKLEIKNVLKNNRAKLMMYSALGESVPQKLWITYFMAQADGQVDIKGSSENVEEVYTFFKNMKDSLITTKLRVHKLEMDAANIDDIVTSSASQDYHFEITNMTNAQLNPASQEAKKDNAKNDGAPQNKTEADAKKGDNGLLSKSPILNFGKEGEK